MSKSPIVHRDMAGVIARSLKKFPIVSITGPRQSGKTTLAHLAAAGYRYLNMEIDEHKYFAVKDPGGFLKEYDYKVILDEVQAVPSLFPYLQQHTDRQNKNGAYILSGSQNFLLMEKISQTLAGRVAVFSLLPFSLSEMMPHLRQSQRHWEPLCVKVFIRGFSKEKLSHPFLQFVYQNVCRKDVQQMPNIHNSRAFAQFIKMCAIRVGTPLNTQDIATAVGVDNKTIAKWIATLEASYILFLLPPYYNNLDKRIIKKPKIYFCDTGILCHLLGITDEKQLKNHKLYGSLFENFIILDKMKSAFNKGETPLNYFWQDSNGREVDLLSEEGGKLIVQEIKSSSTPKPDFFKNINLFSNLAKNAGLKPVKKLIYSGRKNV
ncbi:MAG: ATP-binding protein [Chitinophagaceae bacterium]|nr:ATP-binding protein [Chitinophagaceae bacterium]